MDDVSSSTRGLFSELVQRRDLILVTGKGGTGKSTVVAALAELAARRCGGALAVEMSAHPRLPQMLSEDSPVEAVNINLNKALSPALSRLLHLPALVTRAFNNRVLRMFINTSPAVREMVLLDELHHMVDSRAGRGTPAVVDLPASGHALSFLDTPRAVHHLLRVGPLAQVAARVEQLLLDGSRCQLVVVALPEELPVNETIELVQRAEQMGLTSRTVVVNQVPAAPIADGDRELLELLSQQGDAAVERLTDAARSELQGADEARGQVDRLRASVQDPVIELPLQRSPDTWARVSSVLQVLSS